MKRLEQKTSEVVRKKIHEYVKKVQEYENQYFKEHYENLTPPKIEIQVATKFYKIWVHDTYGSKSRRIFCFIDNVGNIFKAASINQPAKGVRATVFDDDLPLDGWELYKIKR